MEMSSLTAELQNDTIFNYSDQRIVVNMLFYFTYLTKSPRSPTLLLGSIKRYFTWSDSSFDLLIN